MFLPNKNTNEKLYLFNNILPNDSSFNLYKKFVNSQKNLSKSFLNENSKKNIKNSNDFINQTSTTNSSHIPFHNNTILKETKRKKIFLNTNKNFNKNILENINYNSNKNNNNTLYINNYLNDLILKKHQNNKNNNLNSNEKYENEKSIIEFKNIFDNKSDVNNYLNYIKDNYKNKENLNKLKKKVNNVYFNEVLNNLYKKILYLDSKNNEITTDIIMNLLISEKNKIEKEFEDKNIQLKLKNFSSVSINNNNKIFFPLINKYKKIEKEKIENKNILITENKKENFDLKSYLKRLDLNQQIELQKKFLNNMNNIKSENKNSIWELYDKLQNVKKDFSNEEFDPKLLSNPNFMKFIEDEYKNNIIENQNFNSEINNNIHKRNVNLDKTYFGTMYNNYNNNINNNKNFISSKISLKKNNNLTNVGIANSTKDNSTFFNTNNNNINKLSVEIHDKKRKIQNVSENKNVKKNLSKSKNKNKNKKNKNINIINSDLNDVEQNIFVSDNNNNNNINNNNNNNNKNNNNNNNDDSFSLNDDFSINTIESNSNEEENNNNNNILNKNNNHLNKNENLNNSNNNRKNSLLKNRNKLSLNTKSLIYLEIFDENNEEDLKLKEKVLNYKGIKFKDDKLAILIHKDGNAIERKIDKDNKIIYIIKDKDNNIINTIKIDNENVCYIDKDNKIVYDKNTLENIELIEHLFRKKELILKKLVIKKFGGLISKESYKGKYVYNKEKNKKLLEYYYKQLDNENINFNENNNNFNINKNKIKIKKEDIEKTKNENNNNNNKIKFYSPKINFSKFKNRKYTEGKFGKNNISKGKKNSINKSNMINNISNIDNEYIKEEENRNNYNKDIKKQNISSSSSSSSIVDTSKLSNLELFKYKACKIAGIPYVKKKKATQKLKILSENYDEINVTEEELKSRQELLKNNFQFLAEREGLKYITDDDIKNAKIKELKIFENIKYKIQNESTEEGKQMYLDLLEQINQLKNMDINSYILSLCKKHSPFQDEIDNIVNSKDIEIRLNSFIDKLNYDREKYKARRELLSKEIKIKDYMFKSQLNFKPIDFYNK